LSPTIWRALSFAFPEIRTEGIIPSRDEIALRVSDLRLALKRKHLSLPNVDLLRTLLLDIGPDRAARLIERHTSAAHRGKSGVPDLYLFARSVHDPERATFSRFVEVKKPGEPVSKDQKDEIAFLRSLGLQSRVLTLMERSHSV
jgi:hypothetical protein